MSAAEVFDSTLLTFDLYVRGRVPDALAGTLFLTSSRRHKDRSIFSRWHDSQTDLIRLDLSPGKPGRVRVTFLPVDSSARDVGESPDDELRRSPAYRYATQPNHAVNVAGGKLWATNLLFGAPLEVDIASMRARKILRHVQPTASAPQVSTTSHFAFSRDGRYAYYHQSLLAQPAADRPAVSRDLVLVEMEIATGFSRVWKLVAPPNDVDMESANFHSAFFYEEAGKQFVGLLKTGAVIDSLAPHGAVAQHAVHPMRRSTVWIVPLAHDCTELQAELLPGIETIDGLALSHLDVDNRTDGFVLFANFKGAHVGEETHGPNVYGEPPEEVAEHYAGMIVEPFTLGAVVRYEHRGGRTSMKVLRRPYDYSRTSLGHTWLPINVQLDPAMTRVYCTFAGFRPRLLSQHIASAYPDRIADTSNIRYVPPLLMRLDAATLEPDGDDRTYISYAEPVALAVGGREDDLYACTFSPEVGLRIYPARDFTRMVCHASSALLMNWEDSHFRPDPAHMQFVPS